jgi:LPPG:FO 2-phospho-L-lactate transferase
VATEFDSEVGRLSFQQYFVLHHHEVKVSAIEVKGAAQAHATKEVIDALTNSSRIVIAPSNPLISIDPILQIPQVREILERRRDDVIAVSPIINGAALKGPADRLLGELGHDVSCLGVANFYRGLIGTLVIDESDAALGAQISATGIDVRVTTTIMADPQNARRLVDAVLS